MTQRLGFRWLAYLRMTDNVPTLFSPYPKSWTGRYFDLGYQELDLVVRRARRDNEFFFWLGAGSPRATGTREQRRLLDEAMTFGIKSGITVPIRGGFGRMAAFTLATMWSANGDINAGRGSKTTVLYTPPKLTYNNYGNIDLSPQAPSSGAGIATLNPIPEVPAGIST
jgi:LuxR family transcriptional activator of conjugal transfer of Ti plasmids